MVSVSIIYEVAINLFHETYSSRASAPAFLRSPQKLSKRWWLKAIMIIGSKPIGNIVLYSFKKHILWLVFTIRNFGRNPENSILRTRLESSLMMTTNRCQHSQTKRRTSTRATSSKIRIRRVDMIELQMSSDMSLSTKIQISRGFCFFRPFF